jgi:streptomycin 6-kinase
MEAQSTDFSPWLTRWGLEPDGAPFETLSKSRLIPVRRSGAPAMLKVATTADERRGGALMAWWAGDGAAKVLAHDEDAVLMVRARRTDALAEMARGGKDEEATAILCDTVRRLHRRRAEPPAGLPTLDRLFRALRQAAGKDARLARAAALADGLLAQPCDPVVLHGDIHHGNVLDFGGGDWLAIDPWGYVGERAYDYANLFRNPDLATVSQPGRIGRQLEQVAGLSGLDRERLGKWVLTHAGLSVAWRLEDGIDPAEGFALFELLAAALA